MFSSPVGMYRKSYCNYPGVWVAVGCSGDISKMLKSCLKIFFVIGKLSDNLSSMQTVHAYKRREFSLSKETQNSRFFKNLDLS